MPEILANSESNVIKYSSFLIRKISMTTNAEKIMSKIKSSLSIVNKLPNKTDLISYVYSRFSPISSAASATKKEKTTPIITSSFIRRFWLT